ncbi:pyridoxamine 5'-phosphate oxidase family protein [Allocoprobacillus halotolerans]|uniref:Pyridoxamine 5'-phosphate oxidase family protein n=1 Tax=Allocoprobacillus halotolerans TaxID=2944914 RepID=A0ABY5I3N8_9FIRM|nr:pyridoxamine 5'-phosphate oxidase family protein [Allocoprobacillus halotolerans]UTY39936.1 pyridoxamine 5'-phosphate oxidase family protein [Allocoprobacillus halotolerans]
MRRKDREITDFHEIMNIINKCDTCRVALFDEEYPYIVPLNFGVDVQDEQVCFYFHGFTYLAFQLFSLMME